MLIPCLQVIMAIFLVVVSIGVWVVVSIGTIVVMWHSVASVTGVTGWPVSVSVVKDLWVSLGLWLRISLPLDQSMVGEWVGVSGWSSIGGILVLWNGVAGVAGVAGVTGVTGWPVSVSVVKDLWVSFWVSFWLSFGFPLLNLDNLL